jgi:hypothetical protein
VLAKIEIDFFSAERTLCPFEVPLTCRPMLSERDGPSDVSPVFFVRCGKSRVSPRAVLSVSCTWARPAGSLDGDRFDGPSDNGHVIEGLSSSATSSTETLGGFDGVQSSGDTLVVPARMFRSVAVLLAVRGDLDGLFVLSIADSSMPK